MTLIEEMRNWASTFKDDNEKTAAQVISRFADILSTSGALVPVRVAEPEPGEHADWYMTPSGLGLWGSDEYGISCVETLTGCYDYADCYPVRLVPITEWEAEG